MQQSLFGIRAAAPDSAAEMRDIVADLSSDGYTRGQVVRLGQSRGLSAGAAARELDRMAEEGDIRYIGKRRLVRVLGRRT
jgi:hypothetical protein